MINYRIFKEIGRAMNLLSALSEFLGTFIFLSVIIATGNPWAIGGTLAVLIYLDSSISGGHFNPAVTIMNLYNRTMSPDAAALEIVVQVAGALLAVVVYNRLKKTGVL